MTNTNLVTAVVQIEVRTVPVVFISVGDPVGSGFVGNEAHPKGNLTGFANWQPSMSGKWLRFRGGHAGSADAERLGDVAQCLLLADSVL